MKIFEWARDRGSARVSGRDSDAGDRPAVAETQELVRLFLDQGEDYALFLMAPDGKVTDWLRGAEHVFGYAAHEVIGRPATHLFNKDDIARGAEKQEFEVARSSGRAEDDRWHVRKDGTHFWGSGVLFALRDAAEKPIGFAKLVRNRTDVKSQTEALENQVRALSKAHDQKTCSSACWPMSCAIRSTLWSTPWSSSGAAVPSTRWG